MIVHNNNASNILIVRYVEGLSLYYIKTHKIDYLIDSNHTEARRYNVKTIVSSNQ